MGFFSWDCKGCNHSVREGKGWMGKALVQGHDGSTASGEYDGYGRLEGAVGTIELTEVGQRFELWHHICYILSGRPAFVGPSEGSRDQGMPPSDEYPEPRNKQDLEALREIADTAHRKAAERSKRMWECNDAEKALLGAEAKCSHCSFDTFFVVEKNGTLMIRCPNRDCSKLRPFPADRVEAWRALAAKYADQPVIWDDRKIGPHFRKVESLQHEIESYEKELEDQRFADKPYVTKRISDLKDQIVSEKVQALISEKVELESN